MVGIGTVIADDPLLTCRLPECRSPHRVVLDSNLRLPLDANITRTASRVATTVICSHDTLTHKNDRAQELISHGVQVVSVARTGSGLALGEVFDYLALHGLHSVFVEGGSRLITALVRQRWVSRLIVVMAPLLIGKGYEAIGDLKVNTLAEAQRAVPVSVTQYGCDIAWELSLPATARAEYREESPEEFSHTAQHGHTSDKIIQRRASPDGEPA